jgi:IS1 family transposase
LIQNNFKQNTRLIRLLSNYPNLTKEFGDNSDIKSSKYPIRRLARRKFLRSLAKRLSNKEKTKNAHFFKKNISKADPYFRSHLKNVPNTSKDYMSVYKFTIMDPNYQFQNLYTNLDNNSSNLNLSQGLNSLDSNVKRFNRSANFYSPYYSYLSQKSN